MWRHGGMQYFLPIWKLPKGKCGCDTVRLMPYLTDRASGVARLYFDGPWGSRREGGYNFCCLFSALHVATLFFEICTTYFTYVLLLTYLYVLLLTLLVYCYLLTYVLLLTLLTHVLLTLLNLLLYCNYAS